MSESRVPMSEILLFQRCREGIGVSSSLAGAGEEILVGFLETSRNRRRLIERLLLLPNGGDIPHRLGDPGRILEARWIFGQIRLLCQESWINGSQRLDMAKPQLSVCAGR